MLRIFFDIRISTTLLAAICGSIAGYLWRGVVELWRFNKWILITREALGIEDHGNTDD